MKKTFLFEPGLLAEVERESPNLYECYCHSPLSKMDFVDYGLEGQPCFMPSEVMDSIELISKRGSINMSKILTIFQNGYHFGLIDVKKRCPVDQAAIIKDLGLQLSVFDLILNYPNYEIESLFNEHNFKKRDNLLYSLITYKEAQYYMAWQIIFSHHEEFNDVFEEINVARKKYSNEVTSWIYLNSFN